MSDRADERSRLARALALSRRFHLYLAVCETPRAADALLPWLDSEVARLKQRSVRLIRLDPYATHGSVEALEPAALYEQVLRPLLEPAPAERARDVVHVVDVSRATSRDRAAWTEIFQRWNERRNAMQTLLGGEVLVLLPPEMSTLFATAAPDVWSIRSGTYRIQEVLLDPPVVVHVAAGAETIGPARRPASEWLLYPRLALWGGNLVVAPWLSSAAEGRKAPALEGLEERSLRLVQEAEALLSARELQAAEARFQEAVGGLRDHDELEARVEVGLSLIATALDRPQEALSRAERAASLSHSPAVDTDAALFLARWALGASPLWQVDQPSPTLWLSLQIASLERAGAGHRRGRTAGTSRRPSDRHGQPSPTPEPEVPAAYDPTEWRSQLRELEADQLLLRGDTRGAREALVRSQSRRFRNVRANLSLAFYDLVQGDETAAETMLALMEQRFDPPAFEDSNILQESNRRLQACMGHTRGLFHLSRGESAQAEAAFAWSERDCEHWARYGFDRRANKRAWAAARLGRVRAVGRQPGRRAQALAWCHELVACTTALLPSDAGNDRVSVALAIEARRELVHLLGSEQLEAARAHQRAARELADHLTGRSVPQWDQLAADVRLEADPPSAAG